MDKNVSGVDLDELLKAREELNKEIGVETDPNMYSDYNPNRKNEESNSVSEENSETLPSEENTDDSFASSESSGTDINANLEDSKSDEIDIQPKFDDGYTEESKKEEVHETHSSAIENLQKYDIFSAFEVKENIHEHAGEKLDFNKIEDSSQRTTNLEKLENELANNLNDEDDSDSEGSGEGHLDTIDNVEELGLLLDKLLEELDSEEETLENNTEKIEELDKTVEDENLEQQETIESSSDAEEKYLTSIDIDPKFDYQEEKDEEAELPAKDDRLDLFMKGNLGTSSTNPSEEAEEKDEKFEYIDIESAENSAIEELEETQDDATEESEVLEKTEEIDTLENSEELIGEETSGVNEESEDVQTIDDSNSEETLSYLEELNSAPVEEKVESVELEAYDASKASPSSISKPKYDNELSDENTEVITDYNQLREILQRELKESEMASQEKVEEEEEDGEKYAIIEEFKFLDEIATDEFKNSDKFSYIMGKNEKGEMVYGNFREHYNLAVFGTNELVMNSFLNSMVLSLCLKNSTADVNFVMIDSNINSTFEVYNKSSYMYFNRIAKTNKEILDTLIEITKELDARYEKLAEAGMSNAEQFNDMARETETTPMTHLIVVFNNYTDASQATYVDKINACLYQILKFGRLVGIYAVVTAMLPISTSQVNYNLSSRLSFKSDHDSKYTVGVEGTHRLPDESDAIYFNISKNTTEHIKTATVTDTELDLIIKELEE